jgi:hypothetical protein
MAEDRSNKVQLGCGTLIIIAIIVAAFSGRGDLDKLERKIDRLQQEVTALRETLDGQQPPPPAAPQATPQPTAGR